MHLALTGHFRMILKIILKKKVLSFKLQASSSRIPKGSGFFKTKKDLTVTEGYNRINLERNNMDTTQLKRIADALEEILRLVKQDMQKYEKKKH